MSFALQNVLHLSEFETFWHITIRNIFWESYVMYQHKDSQSMILPTPEDGVLGIMRSVSFLLNIMLFWSHLARVTSFMCLLCPPHGLWDVSNGTFYWFLFFQKWPFFLVFFHICRIHASYFAISKDSLPAELWILLWSSRVAMGLLLAAPLVAWWRVVSRFHLCQNLSIFVWLILVNSGVSSPVFAKIFLDFQTTCFYADKKINKKYTQVTN